MKGFNKHDKEKIQSSYHIHEDDISEVALNENSHEYGFYESKEAQLKRFEVLCGVSKKSRVPLSGASILDVGCGIGDLYGYISTIAKDFNYTGIDISPSCIKGAKLKYPDCTFIELDILKEEIDGFDYVFASGVFTDEVTDNEMHLRTMVARMCDIARIGVAFNFLTAQSRFSYFIEKLIHKLSPNPDIVYDTPEEVDVGGLHFYDKKRLLEFCRQLDDVQSAYGISNYIPGDATILITKQKA